MEIERGTLGTDPSKPPVPVSAKQILSLGDGPRAVLGDRDLALSLTYRAEAAPGGLSGLDALLHFDSRQLSWAPILAARLFSSGWRGTWPLLVPRAERPEESDGDPSTDQVLRFTYLDPLGRWPGSSAPVQLGLLNLHTRAGFTQTTLRLTALHTPTNTRFEAAPLELRCPPQITGVSVSGSQSRPWWTAGDSLEIAVRFSAPVQVSGQPTIALRVGDQSRSALYLEGSGSDNLRFRYIISDGDHGGLQLEANALRLATGPAPAAATLADIRSLDGLGADLVHAAPALPFVQVDGCRPTARINPLPAISRASDLRLSGTVNDSGGGGIASVLVWDGSRCLGEARLSGNRWSLASGPLAEGSHSFRVEACDRAGNRSPSLPPLPLWIDRTAPAAPQTLRPLGGSDGVLSGAEGDALLEGVAEAGATVTLRLGSLLSAMGTDAQGRFRWAPNPEERRQLEATPASVPLSLLATDQAGNNSATSRASLRLPQAVASFGRWQVRLGSQIDDRLIGSATWIDGRLLGEAVFGGSGRDTLTGLALERAEGGGWAVPLLCGGRGDDRYLVPAGSFALIADLGGMGPGAGQDVVQLDGIDAERIALTLIDGNDLLISRHPSGGEQELAPIALLLDALGRRRPEAGNRIESVQLGNVSFRLGDDGSLRSDQRLLLPHLASASSGLLPATGPWAAGLDPALQLQALVDQLGSGLANQALIG